MKALPNGSLKVAPSTIGKRRALSYGYTENVRPRDFCLLLLPTRLRFCSGLWEEHLYVRVPSVLRQMYLIF
jgi:hypothetical protein